MALAPGTRLGPYEVTALIGVGGMGEVYRATDTTLGRQVAMKVLPESLAADAGRIARFEREAKTLAALNHPNIAQIYGFENSSGVQALVIELVEGPTLADRIAKGAIPVDEARPIAKQIADALEAAHERGIIHRDLKPLNIKIAPGGIVKVLDFGLAKTGQTPGSDRSNSPTMLVTVPGMILGTSAYMSPELARGAEADHTSDVWAFGCVFYEMLTGRRVFEGETVGDILGEVIKTEPDWRRLPADTPVGIRRLLRRCLQKERGARLRDIADARLDIEEVQSEPPTDGPVARAASRRREPLLWTALVGATLVAVAATVWTLRPVPPAPETRVDIITPPTRNPASLAISPDGRKIVFEATTQDRSRLWLRSLDTVSARPLAGTENAVLPFWSPESQSVGFFSDSRLKRIDIDTGSVQTLADATLSPMGGAWNRDGTILFAPGLGSAMFRVSDTGSEPATPGIQTGIFPQFLSDGRHLLSFRVGNSGGVYVGQVDGSNNARLVETNTAAVVGSSAHVLFVRQGTLFAQDLDPVRLELTGKPSPVAERVAVSADGYFAAVSASATGSIVYRSGLALDQQRQLVWFDRSGRETGRVGDRSGASPAISPDGRFVALSRVVDGNNDIWLLETARGALTRFTSDPSGEATPLWSPDGRRIVFSSNRKGAVGLYQKPVTGSGSEEPLLEGPNNKVPTDWSSDGRFLLYRSNDPKTSFDIWALPMQGDRKPFAVVQTNFGERDGQFSPDGKWIAYESNSSGRSEIYVHPFPGPGREQQISIDGGVQVRWRIDGKELFYITTDGRLMAVPISVVSNGQAIDARAPVPLFTTRMGNAAQTNFGQQYIVSRDGQRFLMSTVVDEATSPITLILNWKPKS